MFNYTTVYQLHISLAIECGDRVIKCDKLGSHLKCIHSKAGLVYIECSESSAENFEVPITVNFRIIPLRVMTLCTLVYTSVWEEHISSILKVSYQTTRRLNLEYHNMYVF
jgi:hypothetical protein